MSSQSQNKKMPFSATKSHDYGLEDSDLSKKADECVQYILFCCLSEHKAIVKRVDINKHILKDLSRSYKIVMKMVDQRLNDAFGIQLVEIDKNERGEKHGIRSKFKFDSEINKLNLANDSIDVDQTFQNQYKYSMIMISLALIFMNENEIDAELFWDSLKRLDINKDEKRHKYLGDVMKYFTYDLVKEGYLEYELIKGIEPPTHKFKSGYRSRLEISKISILEFVCQVYGGLCRPNEWSAQYSDAIKDSENNESESDEEMNQSGTHSQIPSNTQLPSNSQNKTNFSQKRTR